MMTSSENSEMARAVVSTKFQVVIPKDIREETGLRKGQTLQVMGKGGVISLVPERPLFLSKKKS